ncbi:MAG: tetratricopeptide repeat protein [Alphaproteobacteria bacterium]|nr:tetratricopeptide repeat protein [Alphaproteobacteria bacterium]
MSDIFQEVQEEYRREQMAKLWKTYSVPIIAAVTVVILAVAGYQAWSYWHAQQLEASSREFEKIAELIASDPTKKKEAADRFAKFAPTATSGYAMAAKFQEAGLRAELSDIKGAMTLYDEIAGSTSDPLFRDYAQLRAAILVLETESLENVKKRLEPITKGTSPWRVMALEMLAYASWRGGKKDEALKLYSEVSEIPNAPNGSQRRAKEMTTLINAGLKLTDLKAMPGLSIPGSESLLLQPPDPSTMQPLLPDPTAEEPGLLGPATPEQPSPTPPTP